MQLWRNSASEGWCNADADLAQACQLRADAYGRHVPHLLGVLHHPDAIDRHPDTLVLLCRRKSDGRLLGTVRAQSNRLEPLAIQQAVNLPPWLLGMPVLEFTRLAIAADASAGVRLALAKACYLLCRATQTPWVMIGAPHPGVLGERRAAHLAGQAA